MSTSTPTPAAIIRCGAHTTRIEQADLDAYWAANGYMHCHCGRTVRMAVIVPKLTATTCGAKCRNAVGPVCDCSCGGEHHAEAHSTVSA